MFQKPMADRKNIVDGQQQYSLGRAMELPAAGTK
jgi:hypothetical protein